MRDPFVGFELRRFDREAIGLDGAEIRSADDGDACIAGKANSRPIESTNSACAEYEDVDGHCKGREEKRVQRSKMECWRPRLGVPASLPHQDESSASHRYLRADNDA